MDVCTFISNYREAFGQQAELPVTFWYSDRLEAPTGKVNGCFFKSMAQVRNGEVISLSAETIAAVAASSIRVLQICRSMFPLSSP